ncbi:MAG: DUF885 domain-containing protein, partial [Chloroflexi bacterium]
MSADGFGERDRFSEDWLARFEAVEDVELSPFERVDRDLILAELRGERALRPFARWRRQPTLYSDTITRGAYYAFLREHAPLAERVATLAERLAEAPAIIEAAEANLDPALVPREWIDIALRSVPAGASFLRVEAPAMLPKGTALERAAERAFRPAADAAAAALTAYASWLKHDLWPTARGSFAIGRDATDTWLREKELLDHDASSLGAWGEEFYRETESALAKTSLEL